jgi:hypothetical protein
LVGLGYTFTDEVVGVRVTARIESRSAATREKKDERREERTRTHARTLHHTRQKTQDTEEKREREGDGKAREEKQQGSTPPRHMRQEPSNTSNTIMTNHKNTREQLNLPQFG